MKVIDLATIVKQNNVKRKFIFQQWKNVKIISTNINNNDEKKQTIDDLLIDLFSNNQKKLFILGFHVLIGEKTKINIVCKSHWGSKESIQVTRHHDGGCIMNLHRPTQDNSNYQKKYCSKKYKKNPTSV